MSPRLKIPQPTYSPTRDFMRLGIMVVLLLIVVGMFYTFQGMLREGPRPSERTAPPEPTVSVTPDSPTAQGPITTPRGDEKELLAQVRDDARIEIDPYYYMLAKVFQMTPEEIRSRVDPNLDAYECMAEPEKNRGKFVRFEGSLWRLKEVRMSPASGFESLYEGTLACQGPAEGPFVFATIILTQKPDPKLQPWKCNVIFTGLFFKRIVYENQGEPDEYGRRNLTMSPLFIGKQIALAKPAPAVSRSESVVLILIAVVAVLMFAYAVLFRRTPRDTHPRHFNLPPEELQEPAAPKEQSTPSEPAPPAPSEAAPPSSPQAEEDSAKDSP